MISIVTSPPPRPPSPTKEIDAMAKELFNNCLEVRWNESFPEITFRKKKCQTRISWETAYDIRPLGYCCKILDKYGMY
jgi:hypothetical protein